MGGWLRRKSFDALERTDAAHRLKKTLSWPHLVALGVGAIVGTGIYTLIGQGAGLAGPAVILSFVIAGAVCVCAALCYAEMATTIPASGSAYTYSYTVIGETVAWVVGWSLILEYTVVCAAVASGWAGHVLEFLPGLNIPASLLTDTSTALHDHAGPAINLPGVFIALAVAGVLLIGARESATLTIVLVAVKLAALAAFVAIALPHFSTAHLHPFAPNGVSRTTPDGTKIGIMAAASIIFFAFYGFDAVSTAAEETKNPGRDLTIGILGSMGLCTVIYIVVGLAAVGALPVAAFAAAKAPLVFIMDSLHQPLVAKLVAGAAVLALPTVILAFMYGQSRIFFVMARDGLLPRALSKVNAKTGTPVAMTLLTGVIAAAIAGVLPLGQIVALANAGTLCAFIAVAVCVILMRVREKGRPRVFSTPLWWLTAPLAVLGCLYLFTTLPTTTIVWFFVWNGIGLLLYVLFARRSSLLAKG